MKITNILVIGFLAFCCLSSSATKPVVTGNGIANLVIGKSMPKEGDWRILKTELLNDESGNKYHSIAIAYGKSLINAEVHEGVIWRLSVIKPGLATVESVSVGTSVRSLDMSKYTLEVGSGPTSYLVPKNICGISYMLDTFNEKKAGPNGSLVASVAKILVTGCSTR